MSIEIGYVAVAGDHDAEDQTGVIVYLDEESNAKITVVFSKEQANEIVNRAPQEERRGPEEYVADSTLPTTDERSPLELDGLLTETFMSIIGPWHHAGCPADRTRWIPGIVIFAVASGEAVANLSAPYFFLVALTKDLVPHCITCFSKAQGRKFIDSYRGAINAKSHAVQHKALAASGLPEDSEDNPIVIGGYAAEFLYTATLFAAIHNAEASAK